MPHGSAGAARLQARNPTPLLGPVVVATMAAVEGSRPVGIAVLVGPLGSDDGHNGGPVSVRYIHVYIKRVVGRRLPTLAVVASLSYRAPHAPPRLDELLFLEEGKAHTAVGWCHCGPSECASGSWQEGDPMRLDAAIAQSSRIEPSQVDPQKVAGRARAHLPRTREISISPRGQSGRSRSRAPHGSPLLSGRVGRGQHEACSDAKPPQGPPGSSTLHRAASGLWQAHLDANPRLSKAT